jgi:hypothetical protein
MKFITTFIALILMCSSFNLANQLPITTRLSGYYIPVSYSGNSSNDISIQGIYSYLGFGQNSLELEYDRYLDNSNTEFQKGLIGIYTYYAIPKVRLKAGLHNISGGTNKLTTAILGCSYDNIDSNYYRHWTGGLDMFISSNTYSGTDLNVTQVSPYFTSYFYPVLVPGFADLTTKVHYIALSKDIGQNNTSFSSIEINVNYHINSFIFTAKTWTGASAFAMHNGGFVANPTSDKLTDGLGVYATYYFTPQFSLKAGTLRQYYVQANQSNTSVYTKSVIMGRYSF